MNIQDFKHVSYLWDDNTAAALAGDEVELLVYRSNLLGADLRLTNYGGGNTSCKVVAPDPLTKQAVEVMWVKGSGGDLGTMKRSGLSALYLDRLQQLRTVYRGLEHEDEMVELFNHCIFDLGSKPPSIDTPLHAFLPFKHIDHLHPDAVIAFAAAENGAAYIQQVFGDRVGWVPWQRPGFDLGLKILDCLEENAKKGVALRGIVLGGHGLFTWGDTAHACYVNSLEVIDACAVFLEPRYMKRRPVFGGGRMDRQPVEFRKEQAFELMPLLPLPDGRGAAHFSDDDRVMEFICSPDLERLAPMGTSCPDHFLRTKIAPLVLDLDPDEDLSEIAHVKAIIEPQFAQYRQMYADYYGTCKRPNSPPMRDPNPVVILWPGIGMFTVAKDKSTARIAAEFYLNAINVMRGAEAISNYVALPRQEAFDIEYWLLEEAKLQRLPKPKTLSGRVAIVTGSGGGIGKAIAWKFAQEGACVVLTDVNQTRLAEAYDAFITVFGRDSVIACHTDVTDILSVQEAYRQCVLAFGGVDIVVNNAGISSSKSILDHTLEDWDQMYDIMVRGQFLMSQFAVGIMRKQARGGDILNIVSKNAFVAGPNNAAYGSAKAAQAHMTRLLAAELGPDKIRVNMINPDAVIAGSNIWAGGWAEGRAKAYNVSVEELPEFYAKRTLLNESILPEDIANAAFAFVGGLLHKSTGNALNVDGGVAAGFLR
jgi:rhamnulose-1-phosphate aldolase/alcohol dehydrogenase